MKKIFLICFLLPLLAFSLHGKKVNITGQIVDQKTQTPLDYATITILDAHTQTVVAGDISDTNGRFKIKVEEGEYDVKIEYLSFENIILSSQKIIKNTDLGQLEMKQSTNQLSEVQVVAERTTVEFRLDKKVFNVGKDLISQGGSVSDVLDNVPSVSVAPGGGVSLRGNSNVKILINGKPSVLTANNGLEQLPSEMIQKVEVVTNPSARYEASGTAGVINIILKKKEGHGFGGSLQLSTGFPANHRANVNLNYKTDKFNVFSNVGYRYANFLGEGKKTITREKDENTNQTYLINDQERNDDAYNVYLGFDYYINAKNTLTTSFYHNKVVNTDVTEDDYTYAVNGSSIDSTFRQVENYREPQNFNQLEIDYIKNFDKKGRKFTTNVQYDFWNDDENETIERTFTSASSVQEKLIKTRDIESSKDFLLQSDFVTPLYKNARLELGGRAEIRRITSDYNASVDGENLPQYDNVLDYNERIYGAYVQFGQEFKKVSYLLGLRAEYSDIGINDEEKIYEDNKDYLNFFPTAHLTYRFSETANVQASYSRRINRPRFWQLNPFGGFSDPINLYGGNPDLNPSYTNAYELGFLKRWQKVSLNPAIYYQHNTDFFQFYTTQVADGSFRTIPVNLSHENRIGAELTLSYSPLKWLRMGGEFNYYMFEQFGEYQGLNLATNDDAWTARLRARLRLPKNISAQAMFRYQGANTSGQHHTKSVYGLSLSASKDFFNDKMSLTLNARNILNSRGETTITTGENYTIDAFSQRIGRRFSATFTYRFNRKKNQRDRMPD